MKTQAFLFSYFLQMAISRGVLAFTNICEEHRKMFVFAILSTSFLFFFLKSSHPYYHTFYLRVEAYLVEF